MSIYITLKIYNREIHEYNECKGLPLFGFRRGEKRAFNGKREREVTHYRSC